MQVGEGLYTPLPAGRQLESATTDEDGLCKYFYNENGYLAQIDVYETDKTAPVSKYVYIWDNDKLIARQIISYDPQDNGLTMTSRIIYDADDEPQGFILTSEQNGTSKGTMIFLYRKNLQGDITGIIDTLSGQILAEYTYDAYGNPKLMVNNNDLGTALLGAITTAYNPLLYRGYVYTFLGDEISYYLGSRYYIPQLGRFLNADKHTDTGTGVIGTNMFAYCNNNPVMNVDPTGEFLRAMSKLLTSIVNFIKAFFSVKPSEIKVNPYDSLGWGYVFSDKRFTKISSGYKEDRGYEIHKGIDIISNNTSYPIEGAEILSPCSGTITYIDNNTTTAGYYIVIKADQKDPVTGETLMLGFMHMQESPTLSINDRVSKGTVLGNVGSTGKSSGPHLHLNIWTGANTQWAKLDTVKNPQKYFPRVVFSGKTSTAD